MASLKSWKLGELVTLVVLAVALAVLWWGWTFLFAFAAPLQAVGLSNFFIGMWFTGGTLIPFLIRRPGAALMGEVLAAVFQGFITHWGIMSVVWGLAQGLGAELVFLAFGYRRFDARVMVLAGLASGLFFYVLDFFYSAHWGLAPWVWAVQFGSIMAGGGLIAGVGALWVGRAIVRTGVAANLLSGQEPA